VNGVHTAGIGYASPANAITASPTWTAVTTNVNFLLLWAKFKELGILIFCLFVFSVWSHYKRVLLVTKDNFGRQKRLADKIYIIENF
jgi:hypothetical protein